MRRSVGFGLPANPLFDYRSKSQAESCDRFMVAGTAGQPARPLVGGAVAQSCLITRGSKNLSLDAVSTTISNRIRSKACVPTRLG